MRSQQPNAGRAPGRPISAIIRFRVGSYSMGIEAESLLEICRDQNLWSKDRQNISILSAHEIFGVPAGRESHLLVLHPGRAAFRVDRVERLILTGSLAPLPRAFRGDERVWFQGLAVVDGTILPTVNPVAIGHEVQARGRQSRATTAST